MATKKARTTKQIAQEKALRDALDKVNPHAYQEIGRAYYDAVCGLMALVEALELAGALQSETGKGFDDELKIAREADAVMGKSLLGRIV